MATSWREYEELRDAAVRADRLLTDCWNYRFMAVVLDALDLVERGAIGVPSAVDVNFSSGAYADSYQTSPFRPSAVGRARADELRDAPRLAAVHRHGAVRGRARLAAARR